LLRLLPMVDVNFLGTCDIAGAGAHSATEYHIQAAVLVAASKVCPRGTFLNEWPIGNLRLDFLYIHDETNRWGFEITRNGADVDGHMKRFEDGSYTAACSDWLVVDFCTFPSSVPAPSKPKLVRISPHPCVGWDAFTVSSDSKTVYVPRNGIPQQLVVDDTSQLQVKPCVETMEIRPGTISVQVWRLRLGLEGKVEVDTSSDLFYVVGQFDTLDALKMAILKDLRSELHRSQMKLYVQDPSNTWKLQTADLSVIPQETDQTKFVYGFIC